jgi:hypothetical protein
MLADAVNSRGHLSQVLSGELGAALPCFTQHQRLPQGANLAELTDQKVVTVSIAIHLRVCDRESAHMKSPGKTLTPQASCELQTVRQLPAS